MKTVHIKSTAKPLLNGLVRISTTVTNGAKSTTRSKTVRIRKR